MAEVVSSFEFGTKAETLARLAPAVTKCRVPEFLYFNVSEWRDDPDSVHSRIADFFGRRLVIVRSSAGNEDGANSAMAGVFESVPRVPAGNRKRIEGAIQQVWSSYQRNGAAADRVHHVLVQRMVEPVLMSGVLFTQDIKTGAPYYVINYDDQTGRTDTVTAGGEYSNRTLYVHRGAADALRSPRFRALIHAAIELERLTGSTSLDVEFAVDAKHKVHLFQVRRIATGLRGKRSLARQVDSIIPGIQRFVASRMRPMPGARGSHSVFGQMPDWNPAEMIGRAPRPLALSLYRHLITDRAWRAARARMGYAHPQGYPLMVSLGGQPYVDARLSFSSFLPASLPEAIGDKLVDAWLARLVANPHLHDKVEFEVAITALAFDFDDRVAALFPDALTTKERRVFREALAALTVPLVRGDVAPLVGEQARIEALAARPRTVVGNMAAVAGLFEDCIELGTIPFSVLARHAFIARSLLRSLVTRGVFTEDEVGALLRSLHTVARELTEDARRLALGTLSLPDFLVRYGHLRPGTYDILSPRYDQRSDLFAGAQPSANAETPPPFKPSAKQHKAIDRLLADDGFGIGSQALLDYISQATAAREYAKFVFTQGVSDGLEAIAAWGTDRGLSREDLSYLEWGDLAATASVATFGTPEQLRAVVRQRKVDHETTVALRLPQLLFDEEGVHIVPLQLSAPNFITAEVVRGPCVRLAAHDQAPADMRGAVVLIENADPGFDWIFAHRIGGLITKFGGVNSHMAIRCAEFGIPAAIGCGEQIFERVAQAHAVEVDCAGAHIRPIGERS